ncbi:MAG: pentapeptide repeat-containing protein [Cutibacterium avidum]|nr:pentapeptide repeat-containing protein [Cutibacterium avidum]
MNREDVLQIIREAHDWDEAPDLHGANLAGVDLNGADLNGADLNGANLNGARLAGAWLARANLFNASLAWADLTWANLSSANLTNADFFGANLCEANLYEARLLRTNLRQAHLSDSILSSTNFFGAIWDGLAIDGIHPYRCLLIPTVDGWTVTIGCWTGAVDELRNLIAGDQWPESTGSKIIRLRPRLAAFCDLCDAHIATHPGVIDDLAARWSE